MARDEQTVVRRPGCMSRIVSPSVWKTTHGLGDLHEESGTAIQLRLRTRPNFDHASVLCPQWIRSARSYLVSARAWSARRLPSRA
jgi:hypothetical protein